MSLITFKAVAVLTLWSAEQLPVVVMVEPRYLKLPMSTWSRKSHRKFLLLLLFCNVFPLMVSPYFILFSLFAPTLC